MVLSSTSNPCFEQKKKKDNIYERHVVCIVMFLSLFQMEMK